MKSYNLNLGQRGVITSVDLTDNDAARLGFKDKEKPARKAAKPANKAVTPDNKAEATAETTEGTEAEEQAADADSDTPKRGRPGHKPRSGGDTA